MALSTTVFVLLTIGIFFFWTGPFLFYASIAYAAIRLVDAGTSAVDEADAVSWKSYLWPLFFALLGLAPLVALIWARTKGSL